MSNKYKYQACYYLGRNFEMLFMIGGSLLFHKLIYPSAVGLSDKSRAIDFGNNTDIEEFFKDNINNLSRGEALLHIVSGWISQHVLPPINIENLQYIALMCIFNDIRIFFLIMPKEYLINISAAVLLDTWLSLSLHLALVATAAIFWLYLNWLCLNLRLKLEKYLTNNKRIHEPCMLFNELLYDISQANQIDLLRIREEMLISQEIDLVVADYLVSSIYLVQISIFRQVPFMPSWILNFQHAQTNNMVTFPSVFQYVFVSALSSLPSVYYWHEHIRLMEYSSWNWDHQAMYKECLSFRHKSNYVVLTYNAFFFMLFFFKSLINSVRFFERAHNRIN